MMAPVHRIDGTGANPVQGRVRIDIAKTLWNGGMIVIGLVGAALTFSWTNLLTFITLTWVTLMVGHSAGMHRFMIHRSFAGKPWVEKTLVYIGVLVGMGGPSAIIATHDMRDWAQRQARAHDYFTHRQGFWRDLSWQLFYRFDCDHPPKLGIESKFHDDPFYRFLDRSWRWHQMVIALPAFWLGGLGAVFWLICLRVAVSVAGHWTITYFCHRPGPTGNQGHWHVKEAGVQAANLPGLGMLTFGECWHNNHHAFPESARVGLYAGQSDPAAWFIERLYAAGLVTWMGCPRPESEREDLSALDHGTNTVSTASGSIAG
jgi:fatty-acid desaturase